MAHHRRILGSRPSHDRAPPSLARGDRVVATVRHEDSLADVQKKHGDRLVVPVLDLTDTAGIRAVLASAFRQLDRIEVLRLTLVRAQAQAAVLEKMDLVRV